MVWDRRSYKPDLITGRVVPDETKRVPLLTYANPRPAEWPEADFIVGNPPYIGARTIRPSLEDGYIESLRSAYPAVPDNVDLVMYWWFKAAELVRSGKTSRFGLITTNSLRQSFNRAVVEPQMKSKPGISLVYVAPDHPWVDEANGAAIRTAMSVGVAGIKEGLLCESIHESTKEDGSVDVDFEFSTGLINSDLSIGTDVNEGVPLKANDGLCCVGYQLTGTGFTLTTEEGQQLANADGILPGTIVHELLSARDITQEPRGLNAIDLFGLTDENTKQKYPAVYQWVLTRVKPERDVNPRASLRDRWWIFGEARSTFRPALNGLRRMIVAPLTSKHRLFTFCGVRTIADSTTVMFAFDDAFNFGVLSSRIHGIFSLTAGGHLGVGNDPRYNKSVCFDPFPFPLCGEAEQERIRAVAEELDAHRKRVQAQHPGLTLTGMYNVLEKLRQQSGPHSPVCGAPPALGVPNTGKASEPATSSSEKDTGSLQHAAQGTVRTTLSSPLTDKERLIHDQGLVSLLKQLHDDLDAAVCAAYGWPTTLTDAEILERLVTLNAQRAEEEARGIIHWLRPEYQNAKGTSTTQDTLELKPKQGQGVKGQEVKKAGAKQPWPKPLAERIRATEQALHAAGQAVTAEELTESFSRAKAADLQEILESLVIMGRARQDGERFSA